jgi:hypothetical protein
MNVYSLRVRRTHERRMFPFDRVYLAPYEDRRLARELFRYALVLPVTGSLEFMLRKATPAITIDRPFERDDSQSVPKEMTPDSWNEFVDSNRWIMVVPILTKYFVKEIQSHPRYLLAQEWAKNRDSVKDKPAKLANGYVRELPMLSYIQTPEKDIQPICAACPRFVFHQNGECDVGQAVCYDNLPLGKLDYTEEGATMEPASANILEEDLEGLLSDESI